MPGRRQPGGQQPQRRHRTIQLRDFTGGVNTTDSRIAIKDNELAWGENVMPIGSGSLQILPAQGDALATFAQGTSWHYGCTLNGVALDIVVGADGSLTQVTIPGGVQAVIGAAGTVTGTAGTCSFAVWRGTTLLILDPTTGYRSWDGTTLTLISATLTGNALAVFQGRAWLINGRTIQVTSPNTFNDVNPANGATSTVLTDESFPGNINEAVSAFEQLWLIGDSAIDAISNVQSTGTSPNVLTTFSITNINNTLGTPARHTVLPYFRALTLLTSYGAFAISGVTPQKISEKEDGLFPDLTIARGVTSAAVAVVQNLTCLLFCTTYNGTKAQAGAGPIPLVLVFFNGKWTHASQGTTLKWITTVLVDGVPQCWGTDGSTIYRLFGASATANVTWKAQWKLSDFGLETQIKDVLKSGLTFSSSVPVSPTMTIDTETQLTETQLLQTTIPITWVNDAGQPVTFQNDSGQPVTFVAQGAVLSRQRSTVRANFVGWTLFGTTPPFLIQTVLLQIIVGPDKWLVVVAAV